MCCALAKRANWRWRRPVRRVGDDPGERPGLRESRSQLGRELRALGRIPRRGQRVERAVDPRRDV
jgi:hypothetical protein